MRVPRLAATAILALLSMLPAASAGGAAGIGMADASSRTVVLCLADDPYRALARDIARDEGLALVGSLEQALSARPAFLLWVVSPSRLSDRVVTTFSAALDAHPTRVSFGLITGASIESARALYWGGRQPRQGPAVSVIGEDTFSRPLILEFKDGAPRPVASRLGGADDVIGRLGRSSYVHFAGHGGSGYWAFWKGESLQASSVPPLPPLVVSTMSCQTGRIWERGSIGLRFVDQGAAAYSGFYYSPMSGYHIGEEDAPFRYAWPEVPLGHVVQLADEGARQSYARVAFHLLLGDPRLSLRPGPPCRFEDSGDAAGRRRVSCADAPPGLIPVRIPRGARYTFIDAAGAGSAWAGQGFFNRRIQTTVIGDDRFVLVEHRGGPLRLELREAPPLGWLALQPLVAALDDQLVVMADRRHGGDLIAAVLAVVVLVPVALRAWRRRVSWPMAARALALGLAAGLLHAAYGMARQHAILVIIKPIVFSPLAPIATAVLVAEGAVLFLTARSRRGRVCAAGTAALAGWAGAIARPGIQVVSNVLIASAAGIDVWVYRVPWHPLVLSAIGTLAFLLAFSAVSRWWPADGPPDPVAIP